MNNLEKISETKRGGKIPSEILHPEMSPEEFNITAETYQFLNDLLEVNGYAKFNNVTEAYQSINSDHLIVRREDPRKIMSLFSDGSYEIGFENARYSNCVEWNPHADGAKGIANAYLEGMTNLNNVVTIIGFNEGDDFDVVKLEDAQSNFYGLDREAVRSIKGKVTESDVAFISLRIPGHLLPPEDLTDEELDTIDEYLDKKSAGIEANPVMIHRAYIKNRSVN